jgi:HAD superfamily hydrolase (TIGR01509 family)
VSRPLEGIRAITFDFGNTLVRVDRAGLRRVVEATARAAADRSGPFGEDAFLEVWAEERERQFREEVPAFREVDIAERLVRVLARLRGMEPPAEDRRWDQAAAGAFVDDAEVADLVDAYSAAFVAAMPMAPGVASLLTRLAADRPLAILSNWPLAATIDRYVDVAGWSDSLAGVVVSQRVGTIKPHPRIFEVARAALGEPDPTSILHVGDDWAADVVGAARVGWRTAWLHGRPADSPLPDSEPDGELQPDLELHALAELETALGPPPP